MKISEAINRINQLKPNDFPQGEKISWLSQIDGIVKKEIIDTHETDRNISFSGYDTMTSPETELLIKAPYDDIYIKWLEAQIDYYLGETAKYNNSIALFNAAFSEYVKYYNRNNMPKGKSFTNY